MTYHVILSPDAKGQVRAATRWYVRKELSLSRRFSEALNETLDRIAENPYQFLVVHGPFRRALMKRFPYSIYFKTSTRSVYVVRVVHQRRLNPLHRP